MPKSQITPEILASDEKLAEYLKGSDLKPARNGDGVFVGNRNVAPNRFYEYGIILPKGGMIIPGVKPDELSDMLNESERHREADDVRTRRVAEENYLGQIEEILARSGISDVAVIIKEGTSWRKSFLVRGGEETIFGLHNEEEPSRDCFGEGKLYKPWRTHFASLQKVEDFLREEARLAEPRRKFADRINRLIEMSRFVGQMTVGENEWDRPRVELFLYDDYTQNGDWGFSGRRCKSVFSAHKIMYRKNLFDLTEEDVSRLECEVGDRAEQVTARQEMLKKLFLEAKGVFARTNEEKSCFAGHSLVTGKARYDEWTEPHYFLGQMEVTQEEYGWLNTFLGEIVVPDGFVRVANDTNDLLQIPEMPGRNDVLVVVGKTGSSRGVWSYGEWFRGHPSKCEISFSHKGTARKIRSVTLNGQVQESNCVSPSLWTDPREIAKRALCEAGMQNPASKYIQALTEVYRQQLEK